MRVALTVIVVLALTVVGVRAGLRLVEDSGPPAATETALGVAQQWARGLATGDVDALVALAASRADLDEVRAAHEQVLPALGEVTVAVADVGEDGNAADATLEVVAAPVEGAAWSWTTTLELIRSRGEWSVDWSPEMLHPDLDTGWRVAVDVVEGSRAPVLDREGRALSRTGDVVEIGVQPGRLPDRERTLLTVADVLPVAYEPLRTLLDRDDLRDDWYYPVTTVPVDVADAAWPDLLSLPGMLRRDTEAGTGPATVAADLVGIIGVDDDGRRVGTSGLEQVYDERLRGSATTSVRLLDPDGGDRGILYSFQQDVSPPLVSTLDADVQATVEEIVGDVAESLGVVVVDSSTGGVLAVVSRPASGFSRALEGRYPPGLVAGLVPLTAALRGGAALADPLDCPSVDTAGGVQVTSRVARGDERGTLAGSLTGGCDVGVARLGASVGGEAMAEAAALLGLGREPSLPLPAAGFSWPPTSSEAGDASAAVGHARVQTSALGAASLAAAVARGAPAPPALLVEDVAVVEPWPDDVTAGLREALRVAGSAGSVGAPGVRVAGLTAATGSVRGDPAPTTGWWMGFLEGEGPDVALAVVAEGDDGGGRATGLADAIVEALAR